MGLRGLMKFMLENNSRLKSHKLSDCYLVIDGINFACRLNEGFETDGAFGGDYDEYISLVKNFMLELKKCNVEPIILFNGGGEDMRFGTRLNGRKERASILNDARGKYAKRNIHPLLLIEAFFSVARDMGRMCMQCDFDADGEIVAVARAFNCPILSNKSEYFIRDAVFLPFHKMFPLTLAKCSQTSKHYIKCSVYDIDDFLKAENIDKSLVYVFAMVLESEHSNNDVFLKFFSRVGIPHSCYGKEKCTALLQWLKDKNVDSALDDIISCSTEEDAAAVRELFNAIRTKYSTCFITKTLSDELVNKFGIAGSYMQLSAQFRSGLDVNWPSEIATLYHQGLLPGFLVNMILYQYYLTHVQVEDLCEQSSHFRFINLIRIIYSMLTPYLKTKKPLEVYLLVNRQYKPLKVSSDPSNCINLGEVIKQSWEERLKLLCDVTGIPMNDLKFVPCNSWTLLMLSFSSWAKEFSISISQAHIHAFVIMIIANKIVQSKVGYYRNEEEFVKDYGDEIEKWKDTKITLENSSNFTEMLSNVKHEECLIVQKELMPLRKSTKLAAAKYDIKTIHLYNSFQTCLFYIMIINGLLNHPLPHVKVQDFYSGTLLFNLYLKIIPGSSVENFGSALFSRTPNLNKIYKYLSENLTKILDKWKILETRIEMMLKI